MFKSQFHKNLHDSEGINDFSKFNLVNFCGVLGYTATGFIGFHAEPESKNLLDYTVNMAVAVSCAVATGIVYFGGVIFVRTIQELANEAREITRHQDLFLSPSLHEVIVPPPSE